MESAALLLLITLVILTSVSTFLYARNKKQYELITLVKEEAYQLFLHAEKKGWIGPAKMDWVANRIVERIPGHALKEVIGEHQVKSWLQNLYDNFKESLKN